MKALQERLNLVLERIESQKFLKNDGLGSEIGFWVFDYPAQHELIVRDHLTHITEKLTKRGHQFTHVNIFAILIEMLKSRALLERTFIREKQVGEDALRKTLAGPINQEKMAHFIADIIQPETLEFALFSGLGNDFSKIQGRFLTRLQLSSSNTSEVIQKRLLEKTDEARQQLMETFAKKGDILRNQLAFDNTTTASLKSYEDVPSFIDNYPFIPYHYALVQKVFESIRTKGATGKHLAMGERSLLDAFQSAAKQMKDASLDILIPFYSFYAPIESFLEPAVKRTIDQACEFESLTDFDGNILKTLFLIRYVDVVKSTLDNLITLSIDHIDEDKITLRKQIEDSLNRLERQLLIACNGDEYLFLTSEEKEIENEIRHTDIEPSEISIKLSTLIFDEVLKRQNTYRYPVNKQDFRISRYCNSHPKDGTILEDLVVKLISPLDSHYENFANEQQCLNLTLEGNGCVLVKLGGHQRLWEDLTLFIKTDRFLKQNSGQRPEQEHLLREKQMENIEREKRLRTDFETLFAESNVYAIGTKLPKKSTTPTAILEQAYQYVIENTFAKLNMLQPTPGEVLRELKAVMMVDDVSQLSLDLDFEECNLFQLPEVQRKLNMLAPGDAMLDVELNQVAQWAEQHKKESSA